MVHKSIPGTRPRRFHKRAPVTQHLWKEGDRERFGCPHCKALVDSQMKVRTYHLRESDIDVPGVLLVVCDRCDKIAAIPAQSSARLYEARVQLKDEQVEVRIPTHLEDVIFMLARKFFAPVQAFRPAVLRFYLAELAADPSLAERVRVLAESDLADAPARERVSLRVPAELLAAARERARAAGIARDSDLVRGLLLAAKEDVLDERHPERLLQLSGAAKAQGAYQPPSPYPLS